MARSRFTSGRTSSDGYEPKVDRDPFYKTLAIFNNIFKKKFKLIADSQNATDCKENIYVNFGETMFQRIIGFSRSGSKDGKSIYALSCGHEWEGNAGHPLDGSKAGACWNCGTRQAYLGFEHEWQHIIFKSDIPAQFLFCEGYADQLQKIAPHIGRNQIIGFLKMMVNAFDDIRCNSLWEKIYLGSAEQIWERWARLTRERRSNDFLGFIFCVAFDVPTDQDGPFEQLRPIVEWAVTKVKYRGFANMLTQVRVVVEHCMATVLAQMPPPPPPQPHPQSQQDQQDAQGQDQAGSSSQASEPSGSDDGDPSNSSRQEDGGSGNDTAGGQDDADPAADPSSDPAASGDVAGAATTDDGEKRRSEALSALVAGAAPLDGEKHLDPDFVDITNAMQSNSMKAMIAKVLDDDVYDLQDIEDRMPTGVPDKDMQSTIDFMTNAMAQQPLDSQLTADAKARVTIIEVSPEGIPTSNFVVLQPETKLHIARMRAAFFQAMGKQKALRASEGVEIDTQAFIQYKLTHEDPEVFLADEAQQGFSYSIVCDMSGSMQGTFPQVAQASEMLREALEFPFVRGDVWGFRGGEGSYGNVWLYKYSPLVRGYLGKGYATGYRGREEFPVKCGGITPMNTAINVAARHQYCCVSEGMAKRLFLLTDGSPLQVKLGGGGEISTDTLRRFVANEVAKARRRGIQVYTLVIGDGIPEEDCVKMFGMRKFWRRVSSGEVGKVLADLVIDNFKKYLLHKG